MTAPDPSALHTAEQDLAEAHRRTDALAIYARRVSHDLSNFLTVIRTYAELLIADTPPEHPSRADLEEIGRAADQTVTYLQRASAFGRALQASAMPLLVDGLVSAVAAQLEADGRGPLHCDITSGARAQAAASVLADAVQELVRNAREAAGREATVTVRTRRITLETPRLEAAVPIPAGAWVVIEVRDPGPGVSPSIAATVCDPFVTTKHGVRGAGLGLALVRAAAWGADGQFTLGREADETVARLYLPSAGG